jgi:hypothetical protein
MSNGQANSLSAHSPTRGTRANPLGVGYVQDGKVFSSISSLPSSLSADEVPSWFGGFIGTMPLCHSSETCTRAVWPEPSPAVLQQTFAAGIFEVSRFSCMKFLGVSGAFDYAGLSRNSRYRSCSYCLPRITRTSASGLHLFEAQLPTPPIPLSTLH